MTIATKNGAIIVKDGRLAENCGCCEDEWYCCEDRQCAMESVKSITLTIDSEDYLKWTLYPPALVNQLEAKYTQAIPGSLYAGNWTLPPTPHAGVFQLTFPGQRPGCSSTVTVYLFGNGIQVDFSYSAFVCFDNTPDAAQYREMSSLQCDSSRPTIYVHISGQPRFTSTSHSIAACDDYQWPASKVITDRYTLSTISQPTQSMPPVVERETGSNTFTIRNITLVK
jgi:hypothetical protein